MFLAPKNVVQLLRLGVLAAVVAYRTPYLTAVEVLVLLVFPAE